MSVGQNFKKTRLKPVTDELVAHLYVELQMTSSQVYEELVKTGHDISVRSVQRQISKLGIARNFKECHRKNLKSCLLCGLQEKMHYKQDYCKTCLPTAADVGRFKNYGITKPEFDLLLERQNYSCGVCERPFSELKSSQIHIDHCHKTKKIRGVLCVTCNRSMTAIDDNEWLKKAQNYASKDGFTPRPSSKVVKEKECNWRKRLKLKRVKEEKKEEKEACAGQACGGV